MGQVHTLPPTFQIISTLCSIYQSERIVHSDQILNQQNVFIQNHTSDSQGPFRGLQYFLILNCNPTG